MPKLKKKSKASASKLKTKKLIKKPVKKVAKALKAKKPLRTAKKTLKSKHSAKKVASKTKKTAVKRSSGYKVKKAKAGFRPKLVASKKLAKNDVKAKKAVKKIIKVQKSQADTFFKTANKIQEDTKALFKPLGDIAVSMIDKVDEVITGHTPDEEENHN